MTFKNFERFFHSHHAFCVIIITVLNDVESDREPDAQAGNHQYLFIQCSNTVLNLREAHYHPHTFGTALCGNHQNLVLPSANSQTLKSHASSCK
jgi:hypothetical protein